MERALLFQSGTLGTPEFRVGRSDDGQDVTPTDQTRALLADLEPQSEVHELNATTLAIPMRSRESVIGLVLLERRAERADLSDDEREYVQAMVNHMAVVLQNAEDSEALREARDAAEDANRAKGAFLRTVSHELRTPLNAVIGYTEMLREDLDERTEQAEYADRVHRAGRRLLGRINNVLALTSLEAGDAILTPTPVRVQTIAQEARTRVLDSRDRPGDDLIELDLSGAPERIVTDGETLLGVLFELLDNAVKFGTGKPVRLAIRRAEGEVRFSITDQGSGIPADELATLFEPFVQGDMSTTRTAEGAGVGLTIASRLTESLGGTIEVDSEVGRGTTMTVVLPLG